MRTRHVHDRFSGPCQDAPTARFGDTTLTGLFLLSKIQYRGMRHCMAGWALAESARDRQIHRTH